MKKEIVVALAGNPNSGKTSLFNELVGANQKVGNWPGVTIEKFEGSIKHQDYVIRVVDLPGTYSLTAYSPEEVVARNFIIEEKPDVVVDVVDGSNIERNLYLTTQSMELGVSMVVALNMYDEVEKKKIKIDVKLLQKLLGAHVIPTSATKKRGLEALLDHVIRVYSGEIIVAKNKFNYGEKIESYLDRLALLIGGQVELVERYNPRWLAVKLLENDKIVYDLIRNYPVFIKVEATLIQIISELNSLQLEDIEGSLAEGRDAFIRGAMRETIVFQRPQRRSFSDIIDSILINRILGLPIFLLIMWLTFQFTFSFAAPPMHWIQNFFAWLGSLAALFMPNVLLRSIIVDGVISGVGGVLAFLPQIVLLFLAISFLEGVGYMARAAFVIDKVMHLVGLHGKSFLPMMTGFGCSVPAIMATRTLKNKGDKLVTMMIIPFMSCSAKLPVYVLLIGAFFPKAVAGTVLFGVYLFGVLMAILTAKLLKTTVLRGVSEPFVMELPPYRIPTFKTTVMQAKNKAEMYIRRAGTFILTASLLVWFASNYPHSLLIETKYTALKSQLAASTSFSTGEKLSQQTELENEEASLQLRNSFAGRIGMTLEPIIAPLGFDWRLGIALTTGLAAKEVVVSTLGTIYSLGKTENRSIDLAARLRKDPHFTLATALSLLVFVLLYIPCIATVSVFAREVKSWKWFSFYIIYSMSLAWVVSFIVYHLARIFL